MPRFTHNGADLHYELDGTGPPAVYMIGYSGHSNGVIDTAIRQALSQHFTLLVIDNRGAGQTIIPKDAAFTIDDMADDVAAILEHHQMSAAHVMGISMGGFIALTLALRHPNQVRSMVNVVSAGRLDFSTRAAFMMETWREMNSRGVPRDLVSRYVAGLMLGDEAFRDEKFIHAWINGPDDPFAQTPTGAEQQWNAIQRYGVYDQLGRITAPTLVMSSPEDLSLPPRYQDELAEQIPNAEIKRYSGGHLFMALPTQFPKFVEDTLGFWNKNDRPH
jgi:3-oxoadipate enol-lactonase